MREDRLSYIENEISKTPLYSLFGVDGINELKSRIIDIIYEQVREDLKNSYCVLIDPDDINETLGNNIVQEAIDELKEEWKDKLKKCMNQKYQNKFQKSNKKYFFPYSLSKYTILQRLCNHNYLGVTA